MQYTSPTRPSQEALRSDSQSTRPYNSDASGFSTSNFTTPVKNNRHDTSSLAKASLSPQTKAPQEKEENFFRLLDSLRNAGSSLNVRNTLNNNDLKISDQKLIEKYAPRPSENSALHTSVREAGRIGSLSSQIAEEVIRNREAREAAEEKAMAARVIKGQTMADLCNNEKRREVELEQSRQVLEQCKKSLESLGWIGNDNAKGADVSQLKRDEQKEIGNRTYQEEKRAGLWRTKEEQISRDEDASVNQTVMEVIEQARKRREEDDMSSMLGMVDSNQTITNMVANEKRWDKELDESRRKVDAIKQRMEKSANKY